MNLAVVTTTYGENYHRLARITHPTFEAYAKRVGADFIVKASVATGELVQDLLAVYDRILLLDTDIIIRDDAPSIFNAAPPGWFGAFHTGDHYDTGVLVFDRSHTNLFLNDLTDLDARLENYAKNGGLIKDIWARFNRMPSFEDKSNYYTRFEFYFLHYAGLMGGLGVDTLEALIREDLSILEVIKPHYHIKKPVKVFVGGGLGDQIAAEPVIREIRRLHQHDHLIVESHWPELWDQLSYQIDEIVPPGTITPNNCLQPLYYTYKGPDETLPAGMTHTMMSSTDLSSHLCLNRPLPPEHRQISLGFDQAALDGVLQKLDVTTDWLDSAIIIHPGLTWPTRTVPAETWVEVIKELEKDSRHVVVIGQGGKYRGPIRGQEVIGVLDFRVTVVDARNKLTIKETLALLAHSHALVSNDSAPIHLAGSTDIWIVGVFTTKHPHFVLPYRGGRPEYKSKVANRRPDCWPCGVNATRSFPEGLRVDHCINYHRPYCCMPSASDILEEIRGCW